MRRIGLLLVTALSVFSGIKAQTTEKGQAADTNHVKYLPDVTVVGRNSKNDYQQMPEIVGTSIYAGKKNALIVRDVNGIIFPSCCNTLLHRQEISW